MSVSLNAEFAARLDEVARVLEEHGANPFRVNAYRRAANVLRGLPESVADIANQQCVEGLDALPGIGPSLARTIRELVRTGRVPMLDRLRGESDPVELLMTVPGIGRITAERLHHDLGIDTLEDLEIAAHDGRLASVEGFGAKRLAAIRDTLAHRLGRIRREAPAAGTPDPPVAELLDVDAEYRDRAAAGTLPTIAPRRFNPEHERWLPVLHTTRGPRHYTALFSNTPHAHSVGATRDWVILYYDDGSGERQCTVVTARHGALAGRRIVRGREHECAEKW
jgi:DNA polymerase (family X)